MLSKNVVAIIQARMGSTRLPGKVMEDLAGEPMLARVLNRCSRAKNLNQIIVATTTLPFDDKIVQLCEERSWNSYRGNENDVLDRYYHAALQFSADLVVRVTSDCPLIDPEIIDWVISEFQENESLDFASNSRLSPKTFPIGQDIEVMSFQALERAWQEDNKPAWREHVTPYIYYHPEQFRLHQVVNAYDLSEMRWTVDTPEDLEFVRRIYSYFGHDDFSWRDVIALLEKNSAWMNTNKHIQQKLVR